MSQATPPAMPNPATEHGPTRDLSAIAREAGVLLSPPSATQRPPMNKEDTLIPESKSEAPPAAKPPEPAKPAAAPTLSNQQVCPTCGHRNRPGVLICENCGTSLVGKQTVMGTRDLIREQETSKEDQKLDAAAVKAVESAGTSIFTEDMVLRIEIEGGSTPMLVYPKQEIIMGRRDPTTGGMPDVDLTAYAGYRMGVSRRHAAVRLQDKQLHLSDLGSSNGTFINGARLIAHRPYQLRDGDEIRLGQMVLRIFFQSNKDRK
jgi:ribosomal protein L32